MFFPFAYSSGLLCVCVLHMEDKKKKQEKDSTCSAAPLFLSFRFYVFRCLAFASDHLQLSLILLLIMYVETAAFPSFPPQTRSLAQPTQPLPFRRFCSSQVLFIMCVSKNPSTSCPPPSFPLARSIQNAFPFPHPEKGRTSAPFHRLCISKTNTKGGGNGACRSPTSLFQRAPKKSPIPTPTTASIACLPIDYHPNTERA